MCPNKLSVKCHRLCALFTNHPSELQEIMSATVVEERRIAERDSQEGMWAVFQGRNFIRFIIAGWPKMTQQFVGLAVFNSNATYFCKLAAFVLSCLFLLMLTLSCSSICG